MRKNCQALLIASFAIGLTLVGSPALASAGAAASAVLACAHARHWLLGDSALGVRPVTSDQLRAEWHAGRVTLVVFPGGG